MAYLGVLQCYVTFVVHVYALLGFDLKLFLTKFLHYNIDSRIKAILHNCFNDSVIMEFANK